MFSVSSITQAQIDILASFSEAASEFEAEPFNGPDEARTVSKRGERYSFYLGDRFHLKSALVPFRRMWMKTEPSFWGNIRDLLEQFNADVLALHHFAQIENLKESTNLFPGFNVPGDQLINLWLNTVFAHGGIEGKTKRSDFESMVAKNGHAIVEYTFRTLVWQIGIELRNINRLGVAPLLLQAKSERGLSPSFRLNYAFGTSDDEVTGDGHRIVRKSSTKYSPTETFEQRVTRILNRYEFRPLKDWICFDGSDTSLLALVVCGSSVADIADYQGAKLHVVEREEPQDVTFEFKEERSFLFENQVGWLARSESDEIFMNQHAKDAFGLLLTKFRNCLVTDAV